MSVVLTAVDDSPTTEPVLATAERVGKLLNGTVRAMYVGSRLPDRLRSVPVPVALRPGEVVEVLAAAGAEPDVTALVIGARGNPADRRPFGATALGIATSVGKPVVVVPPDAGAHTSLDRVLVPLQGTEATSTAPQTLIDLAPGATLDVVVVHVIEPDQLPRFTDQPQHEHPAWAREFLARYCPHGIDDVGLVTRIGRTEDLIPVVARETDRDLVVLGWSQRFSPGRARVVRAVLERVPLPVMLIPLGLQ